MDYPVSWWMPPAGERIVSMMPYRDMIVVATDRTIYVIKESGQHVGLDEHEIIALAKR